MSLSGIDDYEEVIIPKGDGSPDEEEDEGMLPGDFHDDTGFDDGDDDYGDL